MFKFEPKPSVISSTRVTKTQKCSQTTLVTHLAITPKNVISRSSEKDVKSPAAMVRNLAAAVSLMKKKLVYRK